MTTPSLPEFDIADIVAGACQTSRAHAYELMEHSLLAADRAATAPDRRSALYACVAALESCYEVVDWPANGESMQDKALALARAALTATASLLNDFSQWIADESIPMSDRLSALLDRLESATAPVANSLAAPEGWKQKVEEAFREGFSAPETYNDVLINNADEAWNSRRSSLLASSSPPAAALGHGTGEQP